MHVEYLILKYFGFYKTFNDAALLLRNPRAFHGLENFEGGPNVCGSAQIVAQLKFVGHLLDAKSRSLHHSLESGIDNVRLRGALANFF